MRRLLVAALMLGSGLAGSGAEPAPRFTRKPTTAMVGDKFNITFAVDRETDVAVFIENARGEIVRHLVAGVLGKNPPPPLQANSLLQTVPWDGKADYGKPATGGPFKVRVAIGLGAKYDKVLVQEPQNIGVVNNLAVGPDGTLYIVHTLANSGPGWTGQVMTAFNRDGTYQRTIQPFASDLTMDQAKGVGVSKLDGRPAPLIQRVGGRHLYTVGGLYKSGMAVTRGGQILYPLSGVRLAAVDAQSAIPWGDFAGPFLFGKSLWTKHGQRIFLTISRDDRWAFMTGLGHCSQTVSAAKLDNPYPAVFKVKLPERGPAEVFFGDMKATGNDAMRFGGLPSGIANDRKGNLLVGDPANKRVVVIAEKDGKFVGSLPVEGTDGVAADPATGAVYVTRVVGPMVELVKFKDWRDSTPVAKLLLPRDNEAEHPGLMAADFSAKPPVFWLGATRGNGCRLLRVEDMGDTFSEPRKIATQSFGDLMVLDLSVERISKTVYVRSGGHVRYEEPADKLTTMQVQYKHVIHQVVPGPDGTSVAGGYGFLRKIGRDGKAMPWASTGGLDVPVLGSMTILPHMLGVRPSDGHIFVFEPAPPGTASGGRTNKRLIEFTPDGKRVDGPPLIWCVSDAVVGPMFDSHGNIYIGDQVRPIGQTTPKELGKAADDVYGSIIKFNPAISVKGGMIDWPKPTSLVSYSGLPKPKPDATLKTIAAESVDAHYKKTIPANVIGAEWLRMGISHVELAYCNCETTRFDVDEFGRVFYPDLCRFRVGVLDTSGNEIVHFGGYGNADSKGAESPVIDPKTKKVRPRRADDPKELQSPFAQPDIGISWIVGVGATDKYAYIADAINRRVLRAKLVYAGEETCGLPH